MQLVVGLEQIQAFGTVCTGNGHGLPPIVLLGPLVVDGDVSVGRRNCIPKSVSLGVIWGAVWGPPAELYQLRGELGDDC